MIFDSKYISNKCRELSSYLLLSKHFFYPVLGMLTLFTLPALVNGCSSDLLDEGQTVSSEITIIQNTQPEIQNGSLDIMVFNDNSLKRLDSYQRFDNWSTTDIKIASRSGDKIILAIANSGIGPLDWTQINSLESTCGLKAHLKDDSIGKPIMSGGTKLHAGTDSNIKELEMVPLSSIVEVRSIRCDFSGLPYAGEHITEAKAYLLNINSECSFTADGNVMPLSIINYGKLCYSDLEAFTEQDILIHYFSSQIGTEWVRDAAKLICFPNSAEEESPGSPFTKLVIEGKISGNTYYWTIPINRTGISDEPGIHRNRRYIYDIDIRRKGTTEPDVNINAEAITFKMEIEKWEEKDNYEVRF